jgi:predicted phage tail protein
MQDGHEDRRVDKPGLPSETRHHLGSWLRALAGLCLAAAVAGGAVIAAGGSTAGADAQSFVPAPSEPCTLPSIGVAVRATAQMFQLQAFPDDKQVRLTWQKPTSGDAFAIYDWPAQDSSKYARVDTASGSEYMVKPLTNGTTYCFVIVRGRLPYVVSNIASATPAARPGAPTGLTPIAGNGQVTLSWTAPASDGGSQVTSYNVFEGTTADLSRSAPITNVPGTTATLPALTNGTTYYFWVTAVNEIGEGTPSNEVSAVPRTVPGAPTGLTATPGNSQVTLSWAAPASDGGEQLSGYNVFEGTTADLSGSAPVTNVPGTTVTLHGLINGTTYYFEVAAVNTAGQGPLSTEMQAVPVTVPGAPTGLTATRGNAQVILSWAAPASDGGSKVTGYDLYVGTTADLSGNAPVARVSGTVVTVTNLINGTTYYFRVTAVNRVGEGRPSNEVSAVPLTVPGAPTGLTATPGNSQVTLSWAAPTSGGAAINGYLIYEGTSPRHETGKPVNGSLVNGTSYTVTGLANGTTHYFRVTAVNTAGEGPSSAEMPVTLQPIVSSSGPPTSPTSSTTSPTSSTTSPASTNTPTSGTATTPAASAQSSAGTHARRSAAPIGLAATPGNAQVHLSWIAAAPDGGSPAAGYRIYLASQPGMQAGGAIGSTKGTDVTVTHLANGTTYYFMVTTVGAAGDESPYSAQVAVEPRAGVVVPLNPPGPPKWLITVLAAAAAIVVAGALTLIRRRFGKPSPDHPARAREEIGLAQDVRAVPDTARPDMVSVHDTGPEPTHTVRLEPHPGTITTTIKEGRP